MEPVEVVIVEGEVLRVWRLIQLRSHSSEPHAYRRQVPRLGVVGGDVRLVAPPAGHGDDSDIERGERGER